MRTHQQFLEQHDSSVPELNARLEAFLAEYLRYRRASARSLHLLDVGCGSKALLAQHRVAGDVYHACDYAQRIGVEIDHYWSLDLNTTSVAETAPEGARYDVIFCGEVIEHLFSPDALLRDLRVLLQPSGILILSTPNLGYYVNRLLLLVGISPLYLEKLHGAQARKEDAAAGARQPDGGPHPALHLWGGEGSLRP